SPACAALVVASGVSIGNRAGCGVAQLRADGPDQCALAVVIVGWFAIAWLTYFALVYMRGSHPAVAIPLARAPNSLASHPHRTFAYASYSAATLADCRSGFVAGLSHAAVVYRSRLWLEFHPG